MALHERAHRPAAALIAFVAWLAIALRVWIVVGNMMARGFSFLDGLVFIFSYFTIETNCIVAVVATACAFSGRHDSFLTHPRTLAAVTLYIVVVGLIYAILLAGLRHLTGLAEIVDIGLHRVVPVLFTLYWLVFVPKGRLTWRDPLPWLIYPALYVVYSLIFGILTDRYLYPFANVTVLGYPRALANTALILLVFYGLGLAIVSIDRVLDARSRAEA